VGGRKYAGGRSGAGQGPWKEIHKSNFAGIGSQGVVYGIGLWGKVAKGDTTKVKFTRVDPNRLVGAIEKTLKHAT